MAQNKGRRRLLTPEQKYELWLQLLAGDGTQREIADRWRVDRSTVIKIREVAKHGAIVALRSSRPGRRADADPRDERIAELEAEVGRLAEAIKEQAVELTLLRERTRGGW